MTEPAEQDQPEPGADGRRVIQPHPGPQTAFLASTCYEILFGGQAGGAKTYSLVLDPLRWAHHPELYAITFRRETPQLLDLLRKSREVYSACEPRARLIGSPFWHWRWPSGAMVRYGHLEQENSADAYQGHEIQWLGFDELTHFAELQYRAMIGRVRSPRRELPRRIRCTSNPGGVGHDWVFSRWGPWLDPACDWAGLPPRVDPETEEPVPPAKSGQVLWVRQTIDGEDYVPAGTEGAHSRTFIASRLQDNPSLVDNDPDYGQRLLDNDPVRARQLALGDWLVRYSAGLMFRRAMFRILDAAPKRWIHRVRFWDRAATAQKIRAGKPTGDPDWTIGVRYLMLPDFTFCVDHVVRLREDPGDVWKTIKATAQIDGVGTVVGLEQEPGASGKSEAAAYVNALPGYAVYPIPASGSKIVRARSASATASAGNVALVRGPWLEPFLQVLEGFPSGKHDDDADALSGAHNLITTLPLPEAQSWDNLPLA